jgi:hypothetical protein
MDATTFDDLIKRLATTRLTRLTALRGLAMGALATLTGIGLSAEEAGAKKNHEKKVKVCKCPDSNSANCRTDKVKKSQAKKQARKACNYRGACRSGVTSCPTLAPLTAGPQCTNNNDCTGGLVCIRQQCAACTVDEQCPRNLICNLAAGTCQDPPPGPGPACETNAQCGGQVCVGGQCVPCTLTSQCSGFQICALSGVCAGFEACTGPGDCQRPLLCTNVPGDTCLLSAGPLAHDCFSNVGCPTFKINGFPVKLECRAGACVLACADVGVCLTANELGDPTPVPLWNDCVGGICVSNL